MTHKFTEAVQLAQEGSVRKISGTDFWVVDMSFIWWIDYDRKNQYVEVIKGFRTDFGSVPRFLWWLFNPTEWLAYILHDDLYKNQRIFAKNGEIIMINREQADQILYRALLVEGCPEWNAKCQYVGVRLGGWRRWKNTK